MYKDDFEDQIAEVEEAFADLDIHQLKVMQRMLTKYIDIAQGYDGGKQVKKDTIKMFDCPLPITSNFISNEYRPINSTAFQMQELVAMYIPTCQSAVKKEEEMNTETQDQRHYLARQLQSVGYAKDIEMMKSFGLTDDPYPRKGSELLDRIKAGKYILRDEKSVKWAESALDYFEWRDPAIVKDQDGFDEAHKVMQKSKLDTDRTIQIAAPADGLAALKAFEAMSFDKTTAPTTTTTQ